jgi:anti-sigma factor RsiW
MLCPESLRVQACFDGEVDAVSAAEIERHIERCPQCRELESHLERTRRALQSELSYHRAPPALAARLARALGAPPTSSPMGRARATGRSFWAGALSSAALVGAAAALALVLWLPARTDPLTEDLVSAHLRSLMSAHLIDVASSDRHSVKPWFAGHADVSPAVADFEPQGYRLLGGRADYVDHRRAAVIVYQHGAHVINVFAWSGAGHAPPARLTREGYRLLCWPAGDLDYCAVSDAGWEELAALQRLLQGLG